MDPESSRTGSSDRSASLQLRICELERARAEIDISLHRARSELGELHNLKAPIYSLPNEVLALIFESGQPSGPHAGHHPTRVYEAQVTRRWREVALSDASLWTHIYIGNGARSQLELESAAVCLGRSKAAPLMVVVEIDGHTKDEGEISAICALIGPCLNRWESCYVKSDWAKGLTMLFQSLSTNAMVPILLRTLEVHHMEHLASIPMDWGGRLFSAAPSLKTVALKGVTLKRIQLPLQCAAALHLESFSRHPDMISRELLCDVLKNSSNLTSLTLSGDLIDETLTDTTIHLPSLRTLRLRAAEVGLTIPATLIAIRAPALQILVLESVIEDDLQPFFESLGDHTGTKFPALCSLTICQDDEHNFSIRTWDQLMLAFPTITDFVFSYHSLDKFFMALQSPPTPTTHLAADRTPWPDLRVLTLSDQKLSAGADVRPVHLLSAIADRNAKGHPLSKLRLSKPIVRQLKNLHHWELLCKQVAKVEHFQLYRKDAQYLITWHSGISHR
ncbi:hypothetical protein FIBSPDRAFT_1047710 [Athelia psychrophila]|uniref:Uncharacterized protein n=1 Tax=Athelia psychrophila TaxID=1759441 RepID=A0A166ESM9_9AGAM|nr:hypothetical protein FIBSPDRAFT_1047710 [Fibularhizoctonia sp. CBS 109695]